MSSQQERAFQVAALRAQELVVTARAIEAHVSALTPQAPEPVVEETVALVRATALQVAAAVQELIAATACLAYHAAARDTDNGARR